jgi:hypothetical protein
MLSRVEGLSLTHTFSEGRTSHLGEVGLISQISMVQLFSIVITYRNNRL